MGWKRHDEGNYSTVVDKRLGIAIAVATGDEATGLRGAIPRTKYPKGPTTERAVKQNNLQLRLFDEPEHREGAEIREDRMPLTWILLIARLDEEVRCELSLPAAVGFQDVAAVERAYHAKTGANLGLTWRSVIAIDSVRSEINRIWRVPVQGRPSRAPRI